MKIYELRVMVEHSDGVWRGTGQPVFSGKDKLKAIAFMKDRPEEAFEAEVVTFKKGKEVKRSPCVLSRL